MRSHRGRMDTANGVCIEGRHGGEIPFLWPCSSSWECRPPSLPPRDHEETPAAAVSGHQEKGDWSQKNWGHCSDFGRFWAELEIGGSRASQKVLQRDAVWENGDFGCPQGARGCFGAGMGCARVGGGSERAAGAPAGGPTWQSIMASSSFSSIFFSPVSAHRRASRTGPSGRLPSFFRGASQSGDKATGRSSGEVVPGRPVKLPR